MKILLFLWVPLLSIVIKTTTSYEIDRLAVLPEYQQLEIIINNKPLRLFFAPWHDLGATANAFAFTVLNTAGGSVLGSGCQEHDNLPCLTNLIRNIMEERIKCCRSFIQRYTMSSEQYDSCFDRAHELEKSLEFQSLARISYRQRFKSSVASQNSLIPSCTNRNMKLQSMNEKDESIIEFLDALHLTQFSENFQRAQITVAELPLLTEKHLLDNMGIPLGPALRILHSIDHRSGSSNLQARRLDKLEGSFPDGVEGVDWVKSPCVPPYCWHRCAALPPGVNQAHNFNSFDDDEEKCDDDDDDDDDTNNSNEEDSQWHPEPRQCRFFNDDYFIHPIAIGIPAELVVKCVPHKLRNVAPMKPMHHIRSSKTKQTLNNDDKGRINNDSYSSIAYEFSSFEENEYHRVYQTSKFALTFRKAGWDCMRHYEILAAGCVPFFVDIDKAPSGSLGLLPKQMLLEAQNLPGIRFDRRQNLLKIIEPQNLNSQEQEKEKDVFNEEQYLLLTHRLLTFTQKHLTTVAIAKYVLRTCNHSDANHVLILGGNDQEDYVRDMLVHGLFSLQQLSLTLSPTPLHMFEDKENKEEEEEEEEEDQHRLKHRLKSDLYGSGFTYSKRIPNSANNNNRSHHQEFKKNQENIIIHNKDDVENEEKNEILDSENEFFNLKHKILNKHFDLVIFASVYRGMPFFVEVLSTYSKDDIVFIDGEDEHGWGANTAELMTKGHYFMREIPDGCP